MTQYNLDVDDELWADWKVTVPRSYDFLGERIEELLRAEVACRETHGVGLDDRLAELEAADD